MLFCWSGQIPWIVVTNPGNPVPKGRPRVAQQDGKSHAYTPKETTKAEHDWAWCLKATRRGLNPEADQLFGVYLEFHTRGKRRVDIDNAVKLVLDAANGIVWKDDSQVVEQSARLYRGSDDPRTELVIYRVDS